MGTESFQAPARGDRTVRDLSDSASLGLRSCSSRLLATPSRSCVFEGPKVGMRRRGLQGVRRSHEGGAPATRSVGDLMQETPGSSLALRHWGHSEGHCAPRRALTWQQVCRRPQLGVSAVCKPPVCRPPLRQPEPTRTGRGALCACPPRPGQPRALSGHGHCLTCDTGTALVGACWCTAFPHSGGSVTLGSRVCDLGPSTVCGIQLVAAAVMEQSRTECHLGPPHDSHSQY